MTYDLVGLNINSGYVPKSIDDFARNYSLNTGNILFHHGLELILDNPPLHVRPWGYVGSEENGEIAVVPMANQVGAHVDLNVQGPKLDKYKHVVVIGLGAQFQSIESYSLQSVPKGTVDWLKKYENEKSKNISVRGDFTADVLKGLGVSDSVVATGCPSNFISSNKNLGRSIEKKFRTMDFKRIQENFSVLAGFPGRKNLLKIERDLVSMVEAFGSEYIIQNPQVFIKLSNGWEVDEGDLIKVRNNLFPNFTLNDVKSWFLKKSTTYISLTQLMLNLQKKSIVFGTRIHGCQAALQAGTPAVCIAIDSRTTELCDYMSIPYLDAKKFSSGIILRDIVNKFKDFDGDLYDKRRSFLASRMTSFLEGNGLSCSPHLISLAND